MIEERAAPHHGTITATVTGSGSLAQSRVSNLKLKLLVAEHQLLKQPAMFVCTCQ